MLEYQLASQLASTAHRTIPGSMMSAKLLRAPRWHPRAFQKSFSGELATSRQKTQGSLESHWCCELEVLGRQRSTHPFSHYSTSQTESNLAVESKFVYRLEPRLPYAAALKGRKQWIHLGIDRAPRSSWIFGYKRVASQRVSVILRTTTR